MGFFKRVLRGERRSARTAKQRLQLVVNHDRAGLSPGKLDALKDEIVAALSRHVEIDSRSVSVSLTRDRHRHHLVADIPLASPRARRREIR
jgi:cell division topological specificity factor